MAILEDETARIGEMRACLAETAPFLQSVFFDRADEMIAWLDRNVGDVVLISLDHDLPVR